MSKIRKSAKGEECAVRIPGVCNFDSDTTVLAHLNGGGMGMKHLDIHGAYCCSACHDEYDGRNRLLFHSKNEIELYFLEGVIRTQIKLLKKGLIKI